MAIYNYNHIKSIYDKTKLLSMGCSSVIFCDILEKY